MPSSVAAACSSKSNVRHIFLRSDIPHALLMRDPKGEWMTSCIPPGLVEEPLGDDALLAGHGPQDTHPFCDVCAGLLCGVDGDSQLSNQPASAVVGIEARV